MAAGGRADGALRRCAIGAHVNNCAPITRRSKGCRLQWIDLLIASLELASRIHFNLNPWIKMRPPTQ